MSHLSDYHALTRSVSALITRQYSTSFYLATRLLSSEIRTHIFNIYGFVRLADEIVDSFHGYEQSRLLDKFINDCEDALRDRISVNPVLHAFQETAHRYSIPHAYISAFLSSMQMDLSKKKYDSAQEINQYIYGSADVVGLMCLKVFCNGNNLLFEELKPAAEKLGSAFQKVNFLRDLKNDLDSLGRTYFPALAENSLNDAIKAQIIKEIKADFAEAVPGIRRLPQEARCAVYAAYRFYLSILHKIEKVPPEKIFSQRVRIHNLRKLFLVGVSILRCRLNLI